MRFSTWDSAGAELSVRVYYSVGGGFVVNESAAPGESPVRPDETPLRFPFRTAVELLAHCERERLPISSVMMENEKAWRSEADIRSGLLRIWEVMQGCVKRGCATSGILPGGLKETARGGLAVNVLEVSDLSVGLPEC